MYTILFDSQNDLAIYTHISLIDFYKWCWSNSAKTVTQGYQTSE